MKKNLSYLLKPASFDCNLFCDYCFYRKTVESYPETSVHRMTPDTYSTLVRKAQEYNAQSVGYIWQGGEPTLMGLEFFEETIEIQERYRKPGQTISNVIQTNGILFDDKWGQFLARHHFLVGLSIDGPQERHDIHRFTRARKSAYEKVMRACDILNEHDVEYNILTVVSKETVEYPVEIYNFFLDSGFHYLQFIHCLEVIGNTIAPFVADAETYGRFLCRLFDEWFKNGYPHVSIRLFDNLLQYITGHVPECCMFKESCGEYFVVEYNGDIFPCDFFVTQEWLLGNIHDTSIEDLLEKPKYREFVHLRQRYHEDCEQCRWLGFCQRGCVKNRDLPEMNYDAQNYLCKAYKMLFEYTGDRYNFLAWDIMRRHRGEPVPQGVGRNDPCFCGSGKKYKKCCEPYRFILKK